MKQGYYDWLHVMPLLHFLGDLCKPFENKPMRKDHDERFGSWWGIQDVNQMFEGFKWETRNTQM